MLIDPEQDLYTPIAIPPLHNGPVRFLEAPTVRLKNPRAFPLLPTLSKEVDSPEEILLSL